MYALNLEENGRILSVCNCLEGQIYEYVVDSFPDGDVTEYRYMDGKFIHDPLPKPQPEPEPQGAEYATYDELAAAIKEGVNSYGK